MNTTETKTIQDHCKKHVGVLDFASTLNDLRYNITGVRKALGRKLPTLVQTETLALEQILVQINSVDRTKFKTVEDWRHWFGNVRTATTDAIKAVIAALGSLTDEDLKTLEVSRAATTAFTWAGEVLPVSDVAARYLTNHYVPDVLVGGTALDKSLSAYCEGNTADANVMRVTREVVAQLKNTFKGVALRNTSTS